MTRLGFIVALGLSTLLPSHPAEAGLAFEGVNIHFEIRPQEDIGRAVISADSPTVGLTSLEVYAPGGRLVASYDASSGRNLGSQALRLESPEPYMSDLQTVFPEGDYKFIGLTFEGQQIEGSWRLTHTCLPAPELRLAQDDPIIETTGRSALSADQRIAWTPVDGAVAYALRIVDSATGDSLEVRVPAPKTSFTIPADWLVAGRHYEVEVGSISTSRNVTYARGSFNGSGN